MNVPVSAVATVCAGAAGALVVVQLRRDASGTGTRRQPVRRRSQPPPLAAGEQVQIRFPNGVFMFEVTDPMPHPSRVPAGVPGLYVLVRQAGVTNAPVYAVRQDQLGRRPSKSVLRENVRIRSARRRERGGRTVAVLTACATLLLAAGTVWLLVRG
jgi:hypothetical protein